MCVCVFVVCVGYVCLTDITFLMPWYVHVFKASFR